MIGSEEEQKPRELLSAHESPEAEADVFADRATGKEDCRYLRHGHRKTLRTGCLPLWDLPIKSARGPDADTVFEGRGEFLDAAAQDAMGSQGTSTTTRVSVPVSRENSRLNARWKTDCTAGSNGREARAFRPHGGRPNQLSGTQQHYPLIASRFALSAARISSAFFSS